MILDVVPHLQNSITNRPPFSKLGHIALKRSIEDTRMYFTLSYISSPMNY